MDKGKWFQNLRDIGLHEKADELDRRLEALRPLITVDLDSFWDKLEKLLNEQTEIVNYYYKDVDKT